MKINILILCTWIIQSILAQNIKNTPDLNTFIIPQQDLVFSDITSYPYKFLKHSKHHISTTLYGDSVFVYRNTSDRMYLALGKNNQYIQADLRLPLKFKAIFDNDISYTFSFDSLGTTQPYLVINWFTYQSSQHYTYSGSDEFLCHQTIHKNSSNNQGITIISLVSRRVLFQGVVRSEFSSSETQHPGRTHKNIENQIIQKAKYFPQSPYLRISSLNNTDDTFWINYSYLPAGIYQLLNDEYVLVKPTHETQPK